MDRKIKLNVLRQLATSMGDPMMAPILSFLAGRLDRIHFVEAHEGGRANVTIAAGIRLWPRSPFRAEIDGMPVNHPIAFIERMALRDDDLWIRVDFGASEIPAWYQEALVENAMNQRHQLEESIDQIREKIDLALDAYRTANEAIDEATESDRKYLRFVLEKAKTELRTLNGQLTDLEMKLSQSD